MEFSDKQLQILQTAERLFADRGYDGTSVRDIAEEAGINIAMISYYFGSKEKLMEALFEQRTQYIKLRIETLLNDKALSPTEKMNALVDDYINRMLDKHQFFKIMLCEQVINQNSIILQKLYDMKKKNLQEINKLIKEGQQSGVFKKNVDVPLLMGTLVGCATQMMIGVDNYREYHRMKPKENDKFDDQVKKRLSNHIKTLFNALLNEA